MAHECPVLGIKSWESCHHCLLSHLPEGGGVQCTAYHRTVLLEKYPTDVPSDMTCTFHEKKYDYQAPNK